MVKANIDASFDLNRSIAFAGVIIRNSKGDLVMGLNKKFLVTLALSAEALSLREAITWICNCTAEKMVLETDCLQLVRACR